MKFKDISLFFIIKSDCCINGGIGSEVLVEPMPEPADYFSQLDIMSHLELYEVCVTFASQTFSNLTLERDFTEKLTRYLKKFIFKKGVKCNYVLLFVPEYNKSGVLHYHGLVYFDNANYYHAHKLIRYCNRVFGRTQGKLVYNYDNYKKYMLKDQLNPTIHKVFSINTFPALESL